MLRPTPIAGKENHLPFNKLSDAEDERLAILAEELGETVQAIGKIQRHGYNSINPATRSGLTNRDRLAREIGDALFMINLMITAGDINGKAIHKAAINKQAKIQKYLHHQGDISKLGEDVVPTKEFKRRIRR